MKFLTLIELELKKVIPFMVGIFGAAFVIHIGVMFRMFSDLKDKYASQAMMADQSLEEFLQTSNLTLSTMLDQATWPMLVMFLAAMIFLLYGVFTWYKEWFGVSKRIYTLLAIHGSRMKIFFSKLLPFAMGIVLFDGVLLLSLFIDAALMQHYLPDGTSIMNLTQDAISNSVFMNLLFPQSMMNFLYLLLLGIMMFTIMSVFVLMDRSKRFLGAIGGFIYGIATIVGFVYYKTLPLFTLEKLYADWAFVIAITLLSTAISYYLLKKKVSI